MRLVAMWVAVLAVTAPLLAQTSDGAAKGKTFDVISVRRNTEPHGTLEFGPTPDGYRAHFAPLILALMTAYVPTGENPAAFEEGTVIGVPEWLRTERYDLDAKIADSDRAAWQDPAQQKILLQAMLLNLFAERCKVVVHRETKVRPVYFLELVKKGAKFKETDPAEEHAGVRLSFGGVMSMGKDGMSLLDVPMTSVAAMVSGGLLTRKPVIDRTGLKGRYDLPPVHGQLVSSGAQDGVTASDPAGDSGLSQLGLRLVSGKAPVETLVIDHVERPSEN